MAHRMAKHSFLMVLYLVSLFESFRLRYSTGRSSPPTTWARTAPSPVRRVHLQQKGDATQGSLYLGYGLLAQLRPLDRIGCFLFNEISQRAGKLRIIRNKPSIISRQPQELSHLLFGLGTWAGCNRSHFINLGMHLPLAQLEAQIPYLHSPNRTLPRVRRESSHPHEF